MLRHFCLVLLSVLWLMPGAAGNAQAVPGASTAQQKAQSEYAELLPRVQQGDMSVDFRVFRIDGA